MSADQPLADFVADLLELPLAFQPGTAYRYGFSHDVVARLVELISGRAFDETLRKHLFEPLGMVDTGFHVPPEKHHRFASMYGSGEVLGPRHHRHPALRGISRRASTGASPAPRTVSSRRRTGCCGAGTASCRPRKTTSAFAR